jgi:hypothetical protein
MRSGARSAANPGRQNGEQRGFDGDKLNVVASTFGSGFDFKRIFCAGGGPGGASSQIDFPSGRGIHLFLSKLPGSSSNGRSITDRGRKEVRHELRAVSSGAAQISAPDDGDDCAAHASSRHDHR